MSDQKTRETRSPLRDKQLSYERDGRDAYGENNKSKRKAIPLFKAQSNRQGRHGSRIAVSKMTGDHTVDEEAALLEADRKALRPSKRKSPDLPLGEYLLRKDKR
jgi:hypothetical protein